MYTLHAKCIDARGYKSDILTVGKMYEVVGYAELSRKIVILDNSGIEREVFIHRFWTGDENGSVERNNPIG